MTRSSVAGEKERTNSVATASRSAAERDVRARSMPRGKYASGAERVKRELQIVTLGSVATMGGALRGKMLCRF